MEPATPGLQGIGLYPTPGRLLFAWVKVQNSKILNFRNSILKTCIMLQISKIFSINGKLPLEKLKINERCYYNLLNSAI